MKPKKLHHQLYARIPTFHCLPGCSDCCGPIPFSKWEWKRLKDKRKATELECPYVNTEDKCDIYSKRPLLCRLFGTVNHPKMVCPHGCGPDKMISQKEAGEMLDTYYKLCKPG